VKNLLRKAESVLEVAAGNSSALGRTALIVDRAGGMRVLDSAEWSLPAMIREFGAAEVYVIDRGTGATKVEGWSSSESCIVSSSTVKERFAFLQDRLQARFA
jgi:hypothetical protein